MNKERKVEPPSDEERARLSELSKELWEQRESIRLVSSILWQEGRQLYDLNVDGQKIGERLSELEKKLGEQVMFLGSLSNPLCPDCKVRGKPFITSPAQLYDSAMALDDPRATIQRWTGQYYCPKCNKTL